MSKEKKLYEVFEKIITSNDFMEESIVCIPLGYTEAPSPERAISNVKHQRGIKKKNYFTKDNYLTNTFEKHSFCATEIAKEKKNEETS